MKNFLKHIKIDNYKNTIIIEKNIPINKKRSIINRNSSCLMIKENGSTIYNYHGNEYICDNKHIIFIPKDISYDLQVKESGRCYQINFNILQKVDNISSFQISDSEILNIFANSASSFIEDPDNTTKQYFYLYNVFNKILEQLDGGNDYFSKALKIIQNDITNPSLNNIYLSEKLNISEVYLRKLFKKHIKTSPRQYIIKARMNKALNLLLNNFSVKETAILVGYESVYSFSRAFKDYYQLSPQIYIQEFSNKKIIK